jgi:hypothetical protein
VAGREEGWICEVGGFVADDEPVAGRADELPPWIGAVGGLAAPVTGGAAGRETEAGGWICEVGGLTGPGRGSVVGRELALRGSSWDEGILPADKAGRPPVGASDEARGPGACTAPGAADADATGAGAGAAAAAGAGFSA